MNLSLPLPSLTADAPREQLLQLYGYLRQTVEQLNWALGQLQPGGTSAVATSAAPPREEAAATFESIKGLILKSSEVAQAYSAQTLELLRQSGEYVASGVFGAYRESLEHSLEAELTGLRQEFSRVEQVVSRLGSGQRTQKSYLRFGQVGTALNNLAAATAPGIEIGDFLTLEQEDRQLLQQRFARFTAYGLELFGSDSQMPVAWISDRQLHIASAQVQQLRIGHFITDVRADGSTVKRWIKEE